MEEEQDGTQNRIFTGRSGKGYSPLRKDNEEYYIYTGAQEGLIHIMGYLCGVKRNSRLEL